MHCYWIWFALISALNQREKKLLLSLFQDIQVLYRADRQALGKLNLRPKALEALLDKDLSPAQAIIATCEQKSIGIVTYGDSRYPQRLRELADPPIVLYYMGTLPELNQLAAIAVVGTRKASPNGLAAARRIAGELSCCGAGVISGMAFGIDSEATTHALDQGGVVLGVLGCGIDVIYPATNRALFQRMRQHGCLISEYPPGVAPRNYLFPERNRIISGLSIGVLVVEAPDKSGALITARRALEQNRDVFVVPGSKENALCSGSNALIEQGAPCVDTGWDILSTYTERYPGRFQNIPARNPQSWDMPVLPLAQKAQTIATTSKKIIDKATAAPYSGVDNRPKLSPQAQAVLDVLAEGEDAIDNVIAKAGLESSSALAVMTLLEMRGLIFRPAPQRIALKK